MKKLVIKTVFITIIAILSTFIAVMSAICVFKPRCIAKMFDDLGNYESSQYFYQMQYEKTQEIDDLIVLIDNAYEKQDSQKLLVYVGNLIGHKDFKNYCKAKNLGLSTAQMQTEEYYAGLYTELLVVNGNFDGAIEFAKSYVFNGDGSVNMGYTKFNPFRAIVGINQNLSPEQKQTLIQEIEVCKSVLTDITYQTYIDLDLNELK